MQPHVQEAKPRHCAVCLLGQRPHLLWFREEPGGESYPPHTFSLCKQIAGQEATRKSCVFVYRLLGVMKMQTNVEHNAIFINNLKKRKKSQKKQQKIINAKSNWSWWKKSD